MTNWWFFEPTLRPRELQGSHPQYTTGEVLWWELDGKAISGDFSTPDEAHEWLDGLRNKIKSERDEETQEGIIISCPEEAISSSGRLSA